jgi:hypothetical protein
MLYASGVVPAGCVAGFFFLMKAAGIEAGASFAPVTGLASCFLQGFVDGV